MNITKYWLSGKSLNIPRFRAFITPVWSAMKTMIVKSLHGLSAPVCSTAVWNGEGSPHPPPSEACLQRSESRGPCLMMAEQSAVHPRGVCQPRVLRIARHTCDAGKRQVECKAALNAKRRSGILTSSRCVKTKACVYFVCQAHLCWLREALNDQLLRVPPRLLESARFIATRRMGWGGWGGGRTTICQRFD